MFSGEANLIVAARKILQAGPKFVVVKKGEHGALLVSRENAGDSQPRICALPAFPSAGAVDPTGAGDSFAGGMMGYLASAGRFDFRHLLRAMAYGTIVASFDIEDFGLRRYDRLSLEEIDARLRQYHEMLEF